MKNKFGLSFYILVILFSIQWDTMYSQEYKKVYTYSPFIWKSEPPGNCPFEKSTEITGIRFKGKGILYDAPDTFYPTWASDGHLYSPITDGNLYGFSFNSFKGKDASTGAAKMIGNDPLNLDIYPVSVHKSSAEPYSGRYPCGSLIHNGVWYYGTYCLDYKDSEEYPYRVTTEDGLVVDICKCKPKYDLTDTCMNINYLGPFVGFRTSTDYGKTWKETPHTPDAPIFSDPGIPFTPTKIGAPHFVDFGKEMEHSPDGYAYLVAHGSIDNDPLPKVANASWVTGDAIYLLRVLPSLENMNDPSKYEFFAGYDKNNEPEWTSAFNLIKPLFEWNNHCGCVNVTYNPELKRYIMFVSYGEHTRSTFNTYVLESNEITGPWKLISYMEKFGEQAYFVHTPSKFISKDGSSAWLFYSANFQSPNYKENHRSYPPGSGYGLSIQEIEFIIKQEESE